MAIEQIVGSIWPRGENSPLLLLPFSPDELSAKFNFNFEDAVDDLGPLKFAVVSGHGFGTAGLIRYRDAPFSGTTVYVDSRSDLRRTCQAVLREFGLKEGEISWIASDLRHPLD